MPFTSHGHEIPGIPEGGKFDGQRAHCGGPGLCVQCSREAGQTLRNYIRADAEETD